MPSLEGKKPPKLMSVVIDISSSISEEQLQKFWPELAGLIAMHPNLRFKMYFDKIEEDGLPVSGLIYFTDMEAGDFPVDPPYPVVWLNFGRRMTTGIQTHWQQAPPFGDVVDMN